LNSFVVIDGSFGGDERIGPAMPDNRLAAAVAKRSQVRVIGADHVPVFLNRLIPETLIGGGGDGGPVELRVLRKKVFEPIQRDSERLWFQRSPPAAPQHTQVSSAGQTVPQEPSVFAAGTLPESPDQVHIGFRETTAIFVRGADERLGIVVTALRIFD